MKNEKLIFVRNRWEIAVARMNRSQNTMQWERRDGSYICGPGEAVAMEDLPPKPKPAKKG